MVLGARTRPSVNVIDIAVVSTKTASLLIRLVSPARSKPVNMAYTRFPLALSSKIRTIGYISRFACSFFIQTHTDMSA